MKIFKFNSAELAKSEAKCAADFYQTIGLLPLINANEITSVTQLRINPKTYRRVIEILSVNGRDLHTIKSIRMDWFNFALCECDDTPEWVVEAYF